jgi:hypothetical protein
MSTRSGYDLIHVPNWSRMTPQEPSSYSTLDSMKIKVALILNRSTDISHVLLRPIKSGGEGL